MKTSLFALAAVLTLTAAAAPARADWFACQPDEVLEFSNRVHVRCTNNIVLGANTVRYVAIGKADAGAVSRFLTFANAAFLSGRTFRADVPAASGTNTAGCGAVDCRTPTAFGVGL